MENLYKISKGQLLTIWVFGFIGTLLVGGASAEEESVAGLFFAVLITFLVIFYTIGWRERHREEWASINWKWRPSKRWVRWGFIVVFIYTVAAVLYQLG